MVRRLHKQGRYKTVNILIGLGSRKMNGVALLIILIWKCVDRGTIHSIMRKLRTIKSLRGLINLGDQ